MVKFFSVKYVSNNNPFYSESIIKAEYKDGLIYVQNCLWLEVSPLIGATLSPLIAKLVRCSLDDIHAITEITY